jgi:hypothetical protein
MFHNSEDSGKTPESSGNIQDSFKGQILDTLVFLLSFSMFECQMGFIVLVIFQFETPESSKESGKPLENVWKVHPSTSGVQYSTAVQCLTLW